jgi:hypothetical protein
MIRVKKTQEHASRRNSLCYMLMSLTRNNICRWWRWRARWRDIGNMFARRMFEDVQIFAGSFDKIIDTEKIFAIQPSVASKLVAAQLLHARVELGRLCLDDAEELTVKRKHLFLNGRAAHNGLRGCPGDGGGGTHSGHVIGKSVVILWSLWRSYWQTFFSKKLTRTLDPPFEFVLCVLVTSAGARV